MSFKRRIKSFKSILVDFDGTLVDSEYANFCAYQKAINDLGFRNKESNLRNHVIGNHWSYFLPLALGQSYNKSIGEIISKKKKEIYPEFFNKIKLNNKLLAIIKRFPCKNRAIVSNASKNNIEAILKYFKLSDEFKLIICPNSYCKPKPNPDVYVKAIKKINTNKTQIIAVEDSKTGYESAIRAGLNCFYVWDFINEYY